MRMGFFCNHGFQRILMRAVRVQSGIGSDESSPERFIFKKYID